MNSLSQLDKYLPQQIRSQIEARYYAQVNEQARLDHLINDSEFLREPQGHVALISDHGVVHVRDVAQQVNRVLDVVNGVLIPARDLNRLELMKGYGVMVAYVHDIGMVDFSRYGRAMHPEYAAQAVLSPDFDEIIQTIWEYNHGNLAWRLANLADDGVLEQDPRIVLREMLAMATCHSKSKVPVETLNDPDGLRKVLQETAGMELSRLYRYQQVEAARRALETAQQRKGNQLDVDRFTQMLEEAESALDESVGFDVHRLEVLRRYYADFERDSFKWLVFPHEGTRNLVNDVVDTLRALRCADALRQRGTVLKTSGSYEIFVDQGTANAVFALRLGEDELYLLEVTDHLAAGEANIASSELDRDGNLRISFHRGAFPDREIIQRAAYNAALAVNDIQADTIESFRRPSNSDVGSDSFKAADEIQILLEGVDDNLEFANLVREQLQRINPKAGALSRSVPSLSNASAQELAWYLEAGGFNWNIEYRREALERISRSGHKTENIDPIRSFKDVKLIRLEAGAVLIEAGSPSGFVYIPLSEGLKIMPLGGYTPFYVRPWMPLGITGVIRGAVRNATVMAEQDVLLLMIPKEVYLKEWHHTYGLEELTQLLAREEGLVHQRQHEDEPKLTKLEKAVILKTVSLFSELPEESLSKLAAIVEEVRIKAGEAVFEKGRMGSSMYVIVDGEVRVHDGAHTLNQLGARDVFGEMALLDSAPRLATVTALTDSWLLRLDQDPFYELMNERVDVARGIIRVLSAYLRARVQDVADLHERVQELAGGKGYANDK